MEQIPSVQILDAVPVGAFAIDSDYRIRSWNRCMADWSRMAPDAVVGRPVDEVFPGSLKPQHRARIDPVFSGGPPIVFSPELHRDLFPLHMRTGGVRTTRVVVSGLHHDDARSLALIVLEDVTQLSSEVSTLRRTERERERAEQARRLESLGLLAGGIAHEFNNLLSGVMMNVDLLVESTAPGSEEREMLDEVIEAANRGASLSRRMMACTGAGSMETESVDLSGLLERLGHLIRPRLSERTVLVLQAGDGVVVRGDATQIHQAVLGLIENAIDALGDQGGTIRVRAATAAPDGGRALDLECPVQVEVSDTGPGVAPVVQARMFDPFFTTREAGRGLGLTLIRGIMDRHGGQISVESLPGRGATFVLGFPSPECLVHPHGLEPKDAGQSLPGSHWGQGRRVMVVDDDEAVRRSLGRTLRKVGAEVIEACDGQEALAAMESSLPEAIVLDIMMPHMDGIEFLEIIRGRGIQVPVLVVSGFSDRPLADDLLQAGPTRFLAKPFAVIELLASLATLLVPESAVV